MNSYKTANNSEFDRAEARELVLDAQEHMRQAIESLQAYVDLTGDDQTRMYILNKLAILTSSEHGFLTQDHNLDVVLAQHTLDDDWSFDSDDWSNLDPDTADNGIYATYVDDDYEYDEEFVEE